MTGQATHNLQQLGILGRNAMKSRFLPAILVSLFIVIVIPFGSEAQSMGSSTKEQASVKATDAGDAGKQAYVQESLETTIRFESDGTGRRHNYGKFRVQSEAGVQQLGLIRIGYNSAFEKLTIDYVRVIKADGQSVTASTSSIQDLPSEVQRLAPEYSDFREKHINVPALRPADRLEYSITTEVRAAMIPGQFWTEYRFDRANITLNERLEIDVPADRKLKVKFGAGLQPTIEERAGRRVYLWVHSNRKIPEPADEDAEAPPPDVEMSTFQDWGEVGRWYAELIRPRLQLNDKVRAKVQDLTKGLASEREKVLAIYRWVASQVRYVGLSFGTGRFQPHPATEVFENSYGDCKDKHTLLAAMLSAVGVKADAVLIGPYRKLESEVPSPSQFNHLITAIGQGKETVYADATAEVAPYGYLIPALRDKQALRVAETGGSIVTTTTVPPGTNQEEIGIEGRLNGAGDLDATVAIRANGDSEVVWRTILRRTPEAQWPPFFKAVLEVGGLSGEVSEIRAGDASDLSKSLAVSFHFSKPKYVDWSSASKLTLPILKMAVKPAYTPEQRKSPIHQGAPGEVVRQLRLELPAGKAVLPPVNSGWSEDFAEYKASYAVEGNILTARRAYRTKVDELPRSRYEAFNRLYSDITADQDETAQISLLGESPKAASSGGYERIHLKDAEQAYEAAQAAWKSGNLDKAEKDLQKAVKIEPDYAEAWIGLGRTYGRRGPFQPAEVNKSIDAFRAALSADPKNTDALKDMVALLFRSGRFQDTADAIRKYAGAEPSIPGMNSYLAMSLMYAGKPAEAIPAFEREAAATSEFSTRTMLARAYFDTGEREKAMRVLQPILTGENAVAQAYAAILLADEKVELDRAEQAAFTALNSATKALAGAGFVEAKEDFRTWKLTWIWDAIGWISWRKGNAARAHEYLEAAWSWSHQVNVGDHLARMYLEEGRKEDAIRIWALALSNSSIQYPDIRGRFVKALGSEKTAQELMEKHRLDLQEERSIEFPNSHHLSGSAEVKLLIGRGAKVFLADVGEGDDGDDLLPYIPEIKALRLPLAVPGSVDIHVYREGVVSCTKMSPTCMLVLTPAPVAIRHDNDVF